MDKQKTGSNSGHLGGGGAGTQTSALIFGGNPASTADTEEWNGSSWAEQNNLGLQEVRLVLLIQEHKQLL